MKMSNLSFFSLVVFVLVNVRWSNAITQYSSSESECTNSLLSLVNCEGFLSGNNVTIPPNSCCAGLNDMVKNAPSCLCGVIAGNPLFSSINLTRALELPMKCGIAIDRKQCSGGVGAPPPSLPTRSSTSQDILAPPSAGLGTSVPLWLLWANIGVPSSQLSFESGGETVQIILYPSC